MFPFASFGFWKFGKPFNAMPSALQLCCLYIFASDANFNFSPHACRCQYIPSFNVSLFCLASFPDSHGPPLEMLLAGRTEVMCGFRDELRLSAVLENVAEANATQRT